MSKPFQFKEFTIHQDKTAMKVGTDGVLLGAWSSVNDFPDSILDIGAGTGVVSLMLAQRSDALNIDAVELDENAYEQTVENFERSSWSDRLYCYHATFQEFASEIAADEETYDLIVSNPPFYTAGFETENSARNKARSTSFLSFKELVEGVVNIISKNGKFVVILPFLLHQLLQLIPHLELLAKESAHKERPFHDIDLVLWVVLLNVNHNLIISLVSLKLLMH